MECMCKCNERTTSNSRSYPKKLFSVAKKHNSPTLFLYFAQHRGCKGDCKCDETVWLRRANDAMRLAKAKHRINLDSYDHVVVDLPLMENCGWAGRAEQGEGNQKGRMQPRGCNHPAFSCAFPAHLHSLPFA